MQCNKKVTKGKKDILSCGQELKWLGNRHTVGEEVNHCNAKSLLAKAQGMNLTIVRLSNF